MIRRVPLPYPAFWLATLASLGEAIDWTLPCLTTRARPEARYRIFIPGSAKR